jgi:hypothetical protein
MSIYYDRKHKPLSLKPGDSVYIRLAPSLQPGYKLPNEISRKLSEQRVGPFKILESVGRLAYKVQLPSTWKIHPILSVAHLEPHKADPYNRDQAPAPDVILDEDGEHEEYEVEEILRSRLNKRSKRKEWLVKWKGYGAEHNTWEPIAHLEHAMDQLNDFERYDTFTAFASTLFLPPFVVPAYNSFLD